MRTNVLTLPQVCACPNSELKFPSAYVMVFFVLTDLKQELEVVVHFVVIGGIVDLHCINFLLITFSKDKLNKCYLLLLDLKVLDFVQILL